MLVEEKMLLMAQRSRQNYVEKMGPVLAALPVKVKVAERRVATVTGETLVLIYKPCGLQEKPLPVYLNIHGGGFIQGSTQDDDGWCRQIAAEVGCIVVNIEYHLAPEYKFPLQLEECYDIIKWVQAAADENGFDSSKIAIGGSSAGGNFAAALCQLARQRQDVSLCYQVLSYPPLDFLTDPATKGDRDPLLTARAQAFFTACYLQDLTDAANSLASPLLAENLAGLPPALIITAELDPLCAEDERYAKRLAADGVAVTYRMFSGCSHAFTHFGPEPAAQEAWSLIQKKLQQAFDR